MSQPLSHLTLRVLEASDIPIIADAFNAIGWNKPADRVVVDDDLNLHLTKTLR